MNTLNTQELKTIEQFFQLQQSSLLKVMKQYLKNKYSQVICTDKYLIAIGDIPIGLIAHLDTVFKNSPQNIFYDRVKNVMWSSEGLGADDRAGVYAILQIVKNGLRPTIIFTTDEELGCVGALEVIKDFPVAPTELKYIIELDRRGSNDCVFYECNNPKFNEYVESFGFITNFGSFSDISVICPQWKVAGVNLSIGYYNEHSVSEILHVGQMYDTIKKVRHMLENANTAESFEYIENLNYSKWFKKNWGWPNDEDDFGWDPSYGISKEDWDAFMEPQSKCNQCGKWDYDYNQFPTKTKDGKTVFFCSDCISNHKHIHWCKTCGEPFLDKTLPKGKLYQCKDCRGS